MRVIADVFGLEWPMPDAIKRIDRILLVTEAERLMQHHPEEWHMQLGVEPDMNLPILPLSTNGAYREFMSSYHQYRRD